MGCSCSSDNKAPVVTPDMIGKAVKMGLVEASQFAEKMTSDPGCFANNEKIKITLPDELSAIRPMLDTIEKGDALDNLEEQMNIAAEFACRGCSAVFEAEIKKLDVSDAEQLLKNDSATSCTDFLKEKCDADLRTLMTPPVQRAMDESDVNKVWEALQEAYKEATSKANEAGAGLLGKITDAVEDATGFDLDGVSEKAEQMAEQKPELEFDLEGYIVGKGVDGIFSFIAEKEAELRADPTGAAQALIKDIFKKYSVQCAAAPVAMPEGESQTLLAK